MTNNKAGIIYALTNPCMKGIVKIGKTRDLDNRLKQLFNTSVAMPFTCLYARQVDDADYLEGKVHSFFEKNRVASRREFFTLEDQDVIKLFDLLPGEDVTPNKTNYERLLNDIDDDPKYSVTVSGRMLNRPESSLEYRYSSDNLEDLMRQLKQAGCSTPVIDQNKFSTVVARKNKGWTLGQALNIDVPPNFTEVDHLLEDGYMYVPERPTTDDNTKPIVYTSKKIIFTSQSHFADQYDIPKDYVSAKIKLGWDADAIYKAYKAFKAKD